MKTRPTAARALLSLAAVLAVAATGTALAHHGDGFHHDDPAGTIASFDPDSNMLAIDLANGGSVSGKVTRLTWIDCDDDSHWRRGHHLFHGSDDGHDWDHRSHCSTDDLTAGATVDDAVLGLRDGGAFFWKVDLEDESDSDDS
jgi:hypothetical protein